MNIISIWREINLSPKEKMLTDKKSKLYFDFFLLSLLIIS